MSNLSLTLSLFPLYNGFIAMCRSQAVLPRVRAFVRVGLEPTPLNPYIALHRQMPEVVIPADQAPAWRGRWAELFGREAPLHLEIGSGNGFYLAAFAQAHPEVNLIGLEIAFKRVVLAARKIQRAGLTNAKVVRYDAWFLDDLFTPASLAGVHINFPDPWPKEKQEKHRLLRPALVEQMARLLMEGGFLRLKSDFFSYVDLARGLFQVGPFVETGYSADVENWGVPWGEDFETNYQRKAREAGRPVFALEFRKREEKTDATHW